MLASWGVALATCIAYPRDGLAGVAILSERHAGILAVDASRERKSNALHNAGDYLECSR